LLRRLLLGLFRRDGVSDRFMEMHRSVMERFPDTPWVYGGAWSWFSVGFRVMPGVLIYPYLPLVLIDNESYDISRYAELLKSCSVYGIPVVSVSDGEVRLMSVLSSLAGNNR